VETEQFYSYFQPELKKQGYAGVFSAKSRARTMTEQERKHVDGCAIFYKTSKYVQGFVVDSGMTLVIRGLTDLIQSNFVITYF